MKRLEELSPGARRLVEQAIAQGKGEKITDPVVIARVATLFGPTRRVVSAGEHSTSSTQAQPPRAADGVERSAARSAGSGASRPAGENASKSRGDIVVGLAAASERRAS